MKKIIRLTPDYNAATTYHLKSGPATFAAAPFDTPTHVALDSDGTVISIDFIYAFSGDEPQARESLAGGMAVCLGRVSGRVMRLEIPIAHIRESLANAAENLRIRQRSLADSASTDQPLRKAAHYGLVGANLLPAMDAYIAKVLPDLRQTTGG